MRRENRLRLKLWKWKPTDSGFLACMEGVLGGTEPSLVFLFLFITFWALTKMIIRACSARYPVLLSIQLHGQGHMVILPFPIKVALGLGICHVALVVTWQLPRLDGYKCIASLWCSATIVFAS